MHFEKPYLSIVVASRNDDHGKNLLKRTLAFIKPLDFFVEKYNLNLELVFIDWNPPKEKPLLHQIIRQYYSPEALTIRYIIVPNEVHRRWPHNEHISLYQYIAKNVGIRRSQGQFVLITNIDIVFSDELFSVINNKKLSPRVLYRTNRCNVPENRCYNTSVPDLLILCKNNILYRHGKVQKNDLFSNIITSYKKIIYKYFFKGKNRRNSVDTDACGDFSLMYKEDLMKIMGYPELIFHAYVDGFLCHAAIVKGAVQHIFPQNQCIYHFDHEEGWVTMSVIEKLLLQQNRPSLDYLTYLDAVQWMYKNEKILPINDESWGCKNDIFEEIIVSPKKMN